MGSLAADSMFSADLTLIVCLQYWYCCCSPWLLAQLVFRAPIVNVDTRMLCYYFIVLVLLFLIFFYCLFFSGLPSWRINFNIMPIAKAWTFKAKDLLIVFKESLWPRNNAKDNNAGNKSIDSDSDSTVHACWFSTQLKVPHKPCIVCCYKPTLHFCATHVALTRHRDSMDNKAAKVQNAELMSTGATGGAGFASARCVEYFSCIRASSSPTVLTVACNQLNACLYVLDLNCSK